MKKRKFTAADRSSALINIAHAISLARVAKAKSAQEQTI
jgi:hypothetical protein